ncbi:LOW QUALITY PROTEIN: hypothetical protein MKX08_005951 [Trichoderma sp. CBMAI-0020]|nr:LOW QUALITY PROTEIN: hypothetical protein MKX08_005951 [Trichoderma sp. CBMAI-0020]
MSPSVRQDWSSNWFSLKSGLTKEFESINPKRRVPVLIMDKKVNTEISHGNRNCCAGSTHLWDNSAREIRVYEWLSYLSTTADGQAIAETWRTEKFIDIYP